MLARAVRENPRLQWVQTMAAGGGSTVRDADLTPEELDRVVFTTSAGVHGPTLTEFAVFGLLAGAKDHITPPAQVFALADFAATPEEEVLKLTTSGGHLGIFMGHEALRTCWRPVFADIAARSAHQLPLPPP